MAAWPGGPCPDCGDDMPSNLIHCQRCRALLNPKLKPLSIEIPDFVPLRELESPESLKDEPINIVTLGYFCECPSCRKELKISRQFQGQTVACKFCDASFNFDANQESLHISAVVLHCPQCTNKLRVSTKYLGMKVLCNFCSQTLVIHEPILNVSQP
jgi:hypothetical protein